MTEDAGQGSDGDPVEKQGLAAPEAVPDTALGEERLQAQARAFLRAHDSVLGGGGIVVTGVACALAIEVSRRVRVAGRRVSASATR